MAKGTLHLNVEFSAITDEEGKFGRLASLLGLADADHARGKCEHLWLACTRRGESDLPQWLVEQLLGACGPEALVEAELASWAAGRGDSSCRRLHIRGAAKHCLWMSSSKDQLKREQRVKGGESRAKTSSRQLDGTFAPRPAEHPAQSSSSASASASASEEDLGADSPDAEPATPPAAPLTLTPEPPAGPPRTAPPGRRARMPTEWSPSRTDANVNAEREASERGVDVSNELVKFRDWAVGKGEPKADWNATWRNWTRNARPQQNFRPRGSAERAPDPPRKIPTLA